MQAGLLTEKIIIEKPTIQQNEFGANAIRWTELITTRAGVTFSDGNRTNENNEIVFTNSEIFKIRYYHTIDEKDRVLWNNKKYRILSLEPNKNRQSLTIKTELINE